MSRTALFAAGGALLVVAVLAGLAFTSHDVGAATPAPRSAAPSAAPDTEIATQLASLRREVAALRSAADDAKASSEAGDAPSDETDTAAPPPPPPTDSERRPYYEDRFASDPVDPVWARSTEQAITGVMARDELRGSRLVAARCHGNLCRIEVSHTDDGAQSRFLPEVTRFPPFLNAGVAQTVRDPDPPERVSTVIFLAREGQTLPHLADPI